MKLPGIRSLHDFLFVKHAATKQLVAKVRDTCYDGVFTNAPIHVIHGKSIERAVFLIKRVEAMPVSD